MAIDILNPNLNLPVFSPPVGPIPTNEDLVKLSQGILLLFKLNEQTQFAKVAGDLVAAQCNINPPAGIPQPAEILKKIGTIVAPGPGEFGAGSNVLDVVRRNFVELSNKVTNLLQEYTKSQVEITRLATALNVSNTALNAANVALQKEISSNELPPVGTQQTTTTTTSVTPVTSSPIQTVPSGQTPTSNQPKTNYTSLLAGVAALGLLGAGAWYLYKNPPKPMVHENPLIVSTTRKVSRKVRRIKKKK